MASSLAIFEKNKHVASAEDVIPALLHIYAHAGLRKLNTSLKYWRCDRSYVALYGWNEDKEAFEYCWKTVKGVVSFFESLESGMKEVAFKD